MDISTKGRRPSPAASTLALPVDDALLVRLHGKACIICGTHAGLLIADGHRYTATTGGGCLGWPVVVCAAHHQGQP